MPNSTQVAAVLRAAALDAKRSRVAGMPLKAQTEYILLVAGQQARRQRRFDLAMTFHLARCVLKASTSITEAWNSLQSEAVLDSEIVPTTPVSNTGVTEAPATVPIEYFTGKG